jgi:hypothetical protein
MHIYSSATSGDPDQLVHPSHLIWIYTGHILVRNNLINLKANSVDPDQMAQKLKGSVRHLVRQDVKICQTETNSV